MNEVTVTLVNNSGPIGDMLLANHFNPASLRPYIDKNGRSYIANAAGGDPIPVTNATLLKDEWIQIDRAVTTAARQRLVLSQLFRSKGMTYNLPNAMRKTLLQYQNRGNVSAATMSMDALAKGTNDAPPFDITTLPLPIVHKDFFFTARELEVSRNEGVPLDVSTAEESARMVAEYIEQMIVGTSSYAYGGGTIYGLINFPSRNTLNITDWTASAKTMEGMLTDVLNMKQGLINDRFFGPYILILPSNWEYLLDKDYKSYSEATLRERIMRIGGISDVVVADFMTASNAVMIQATNSVFDLIDGFLPMTLQWQPEPMLYRFKVMAIQVPRCRADYNGRCGIIHAV